MSDEESDLQVGLGKPVSYAEKEDDSSDGSEAFAPSPRRNRGSGGKPKAKKTKQLFIDDSGGEEKRQKPKRAAGKSPKPKRAEREASGDLGEDEDGSRRESDSEEDGEDAGEEGALGTPGLPGGAARQPKPKKAPTKLKLLENAMKANKWWEAAPLPDKVKWLTLEHNGVQFPPPYEPHGVQFMYDGRPVPLNVEQEELATYYAACLGSQQLEKESTAKVFNKNFMASFREKLGADHVVQRFEKCDFSAIRAHLDAQREARKNMSREEKELAKAKESESKLKYCFAVVDGALVKVANSLIEPPGLFRGRGEHPKAGKLKPRIVPEDITLNLGESSPVPPCPIPGHAWGGVVTNRETTWLASWKDMSGNNKYVYLSASSHFKGMADRDKYEKARMLKQRIPKIREDYTAKMTSSDDTTRQIATATWVIDKLALRVGGEKDEDEADTVGTCSLRVEHVKLQRPATLMLDFLGKDSMRHLASYDLSDTKVYGHVGALAFANFERFTQNKAPADQVLDRIDPTTLNEHLKTLMPGLSAKVFRTYNASVTLEKELPKTMPPGATMQEKESLYNAANRQVAILCNHQKSVSKAAEAGLGKKHLEMEELERQVDELRKMLVRVRAGKDLALRPDGGEEEDKDARRKHSHMFDVQPSAQQVESRLAQFEKKLDTMRHKTGEQEKNMTVALGTSKINYMDPRISVAWCKRNEMPIEKIYSATQREKFPWAMSVDHTFQF